VSGCCCFYILPADTLSTRQSLGKNLRGSRIDTNFHLIKIFKHIQSFFSFKKRKTSEKKSLTNFPFSIYFGLNPKIRPQRKLTESEMTQNVKTTDQNGFCCRRPDGLVDRRERRQRRSERGVRFKIELDLK